MPKKESILGIRTDILDLEEAVQRAGEMLKKEGPSCIVSVNPEIVMKALSDSFLRRLLNSADMAIPDGVGIVFSSWLKGGEIRHRVTGIDLMEKLLELAAREGYRVFFLGSAPGVAREAAEKMKKKYPGLVVAGTHHGYFPPEEEKMVAEKIAAARTDLLFIGMGSDRQEKFMFRHGKRCGARLMMVVGGSMDVLSGRKKRAPLFIQRLGVEWLYRVFQEPRRLRRVSVLPLYLKKILAPVKSGRFRFLGLEIDMVTYEDALAKVKEHIASREPLWIVAINPEKMVKAWENMELRALLKRSNMAIPDGIGILIAGWLMGHHFPQRVTGVDLFLLLAKEAARAGWRVYLLGAAPGVAEEVATRLSREYPGLKFAGTHHGYYSPEEEDELVGKISSCRPDILFVAMGSPKQERFIAAHQERLQVPVCMGVGGSFDVISGRAKRAPFWMQKMGLEWSYRLFREPRRAMRMLAIPRFIILMFMYRLGFFHPK